MKKIVKDLTMLFFIVICGILVGGALICLLYTMPTARVGANAKESESMYSDKMISYWVDNKKYARLSNYTEAIMINIALSRPYDSLLDNAFLNPRLEFKEKTPQENLCRLLDMNDNQNVLKDASVKNYARYWHGYLLYLIPLLQLFNVGEMKAIMLFFQFFLALLVLYEIGKHSSLYMFLFAFVILFINPITTVMTFQDADIYIIMLIFSAIILKCNQWLMQKEALAMLFCVDGILVAFFDFLTYPLVALGVPLLIIFIINEIDCIEGLILMIKLSSAWAFGYLGMWLGKWVLASCFTRENTISDGINQVLYRTQGDPTVTEKAVSGTNIYAFKVVLWVVKDPVYYVLAMMLILVLLVYIGQGYRLRVSKEKLIRILPVAIIGMSPLFWFLVAKNHTIVHPHLEFRNLAVTVWAGLIIVAKMMEKNAHDIQKP